MIYILSPAILCVSGLLIGVISNILNYTAYVPFFCQLSLWIACIYANWKMKGIILCGMFALQYGQYLYKKDYQCYLLTFMSIIGSMITLEYNHWLSQYIGLEINILPIYALLIKESSKEDMDVCMQYIIANVVFSMILLYGLVLMHGYQLSLSNNFSHVGILFISIAMGFKLGLVPFHTWVPRIFQCAHWFPLLCLNTFSKVCATVIWVHCLHMYHDRWIVALITAMAIASISWGNMKALVQKKIRLLIAYSGMAHMGYMTLAFAMISTTQQEFNHLILFYIISYAGINILLFSALINLVKEVSYEEIGSNMHVIPLWALIFSLISMAGMPMFPGFFPKIGLLYLTTSYIWFSLIIVMASTLSGLLLLFYFSLIRALVLTKSMRQAYLPRKIQWLFILHIIVLSLISFIPHI